MRWIVVGGAGFVGAAVCAHLRKRDDTAVSVDLHVDSSAPSASSISCDVLVDDIAMPPGRVVLALGRSMPRPVRPWTLMLDNAVATARLTPQLASRDVTLLSSVEVYGWAEGPLREDTSPRLPVSAAEIAAWCDRATAVAQQPCPPYRVARLCRDLADLDPSGRWVYAIAKAAQEEIVRRAVPADRLTVLRCANIVGPAQWRFVGRLVEAFLDGRTCPVTSTIRSFVSVEELARVVAELPAGGVYNVSSGSLPLIEVAELVAGELGRTALVQVVPAPAEDSDGVVVAANLCNAMGALEDVRIGLRRCARVMAERPAPMFRPALPVVLPPRPEQPDVVAERVSAALWSGSLRGGRWTDQLTERLREEIGCHDRQLILTNSGTNALRLAIEAVAGAPAPGDVALCPAYTFHATTEALYQLGYTVRLLDVDARTWTMDPAQVAAALMAAPVRVVVAVDALGNPCDYAALGAICRQAGVPLVADSAAALGSRYAGHPVGLQADAHAFSMSFAKVVSGGGSGGVVVLPAGSAPRSDRNWLRSAGMTEVSAVVALDNVEALESVIARRQRVAGVYQTVLFGALRFTPQEVRRGDRHSFVHWVTRVDPSVGRDQLAAALADEGVATKRYYEPLAGPSQPPRATPVTAVLHHEALALPMSSELSVDDAERVAASVLRAVRRLARSDVGPTPDRSVVVPAAH